MQLKEINGMENYLENDCYCKGEIYDATGFFFDVYTGEEDCKKLGEKDSYLFVFCKDQILYIQAGIKVIDNQDITKLTFTEHVIESITRFDATENNIDQVKKFISGEVKSITLDEFKPETTKKILDEIMGVADAILVEDEPGSMQKSLNDIMNAADTTTMD